MAEYECAQNELVVSSDTWGYIHHKQHHKITNYLNKIHTRPHGAHGNSTILEFRGSKVMCNVNRNAVDLIVRRTEEDVTTVDIDLATSLLSSGDKNEAATRLEADLSHLYLRTTGTKLYMTGAKKSIGNARSEAQKQLKVTGTGTLRRQRDFSKPQLTPAVYVPAQTTTTQPQTTTTTQPTTNSTTQPPPITTITQPPPRTIQLPTSTIQPPTTNSTIQPPTTTQPPRLYQEHNVSRAAFQMELDAVLRNPLVQRSGKPNPKRYEEGTEEPIVLHGEPYTDNTVPVPAKPYTDNTVPVPAKPYTDNTVPVPAKPYTDNTVPVPVKPYTDNTVPVPAKPYTDNTVPVPAKPYTDNTVPVPAKPYTDNTVPVPAKPYTDNTVPVPAKPYTDNIVPVPAKPYTDNTVPVPAKPYTDNTVPAPAKPYTDNTVSVPAKLYTDNTASKSPADTNVQSFKSTTTSCHVHVVQQDISKVKAAALVCPTNEMMTLEDGVARVISEVAGPQLQQYCTGFVHSQGKLGLSQAVLCPGYDTLADRVLCVHGPRWTGTDNRDKCSFQLAMAFSNCLEAAEREGLESIAFPAISSGISGVPVDVVAEQAFSAIQQHIENTTGRLQHLFIVDLNKGFLDRMRVKLSNEKFEVIESSLTEFIVNVDSADNNPTTTVVPIISTGTDTTTCTTTTSTTTTSATTLSTTTTSSTLVASSPVQEEVFIDAYIWQYVSNIQPSKIANIQKLCGVKLMTQKNDDMAHITITGKHLSKAVDLIGQLEKDMTKSIRHDHVPISLKHIPFVKRQLQRLVKKHKDFFFSLQDTDVILIGPRSNLHKVKAFTELEIAPPVEIPTSPCNPLHISGYKEGSRTRRSLAPRIGTGDSMLSLEDKLKHWSLASPNPSSDLLPWELYHPPPKHGAIPNTRHRAQPTGRLFQDSSPKHPPGRNTRPTHDRGHLAIPTPQPRIARKTARQDGAGGFPMRKAASLANMYEHTPDSRKPVKKHYRHRSQGMVI